MFQPNYQRIKCAIFIALALIFSHSCGGGGGGDDSNPPTENAYPITTDTIFRYDGGQVLLYDYSYDAHWGDGSGAVSLDGTETVYFYKDQDRPGCLERITEIESNSGSFSFLDVYFFSDQGFVHYLTSDLLYYTNQNDHSAGALVMPHVITAGDSWQNTDLLIVYDGTNFYGTRTFIVIGKEIISPPIGCMEAYKINHSGTFEETEWFMPEKLNVVGTIWVHPEIGIIKSVENTVRQRAVGDYYYHITDELVSINWRPEN